MTLSENTPRYWLVACKTCDDASGWPETPIPHLSAEKRDWWKNEHLKDYPDHEVRTWEEA